MSVYCRVICTVMVQVPAVRAEACHTLCSLRKKKEKEEEREEGWEDRLISTLRERLVVYRR